MKKNVKEKYFKIALKYFRFKKTFIRQKYPFDGKYVIPEVT